MRNSPTVDVWLEKHPPDVQKITGELMAVARKNMPGVWEFIDQDTVRYSIHDSRSDQICYIAPQKKGYVNFGFFFGAGLPDPKKLLIGEGKRLRHVKIWSVEDAQNPSLAKLIAATWKEAPQKVAEIHTSMKNRSSSHG